MAVLARELPSLDDLDLHEPIDQGVDKAGGLQFYPHISTRLTLSSRDCVSDAQIVALALTEACCKLGTGKVRRSRRKISHCNCHWWARSSTFPFHCVQSSPHWNQQTSNSPIKLWIAIGNHQISYTFTRTGAAKIKRNGTRWHILVLRKSNRHEMTRYRWPQA